MILTQADIDDFYDAACPLLESDDEDGLSAFFAWLNNHPQVFMAAGFQEYVSAHESPGYRQLADTGIEDYARPLFRDYQGSWILPSWATTDRGKPWSGMRLEALMASVERRAEIRNIVAQLSSRKMEDVGQKWKLDEEIELMDADCEIALPDIDQIVRTASKYIDNPLVDSTVFVSPRLWTPTNQTAQKAILQASVADLIATIQQEKKELRSIPWQQLEEIVAEVLRAKGMAIHVVKETPQGGRDIIARFPIGPTGEMATIAVEVKHRELVDRPVLQQALYQNRMYSGLMLVTSGRFTTGVVSEVAKPENRMRIFLKDGVAIRDMVKSYRLDAAT